MKGRTIIRFPDQGDGVANWHHARKIVDGEEEATETLHFRTVREAKDYMANLVGGETKGSAFASVDRDLRGLLTETRKGGIMGILRFFGFRRAS